MFEFTSILFARPSFIEGVSRCLDVGNTLTDYNASVSGQLADLRALTADWNAIGFDLRVAVERVQHGKKTGEKSSI